MKKSHFLGDWWFLCDLLCHFWWIFGWDWGTPAILRQYPNIYGHFQGKLGFGQFWKKVGIGSDPPPSLGQNPNFYQKFVLEASLISWFKIFNLQFLFPTESTLVSDCRDRNWKWIPKYIFSTKKIWAPPKNNNRFSWFPVVIWGTLRHIYSQ